MAETRGKRNHNPLNIRKGNNWQGEASNPSEKEFEVFQNDAYGLRAGFVILKNYMRRSPRVDTIEKIITRWAPPEDGNDTDAYIRTVSKRTGIGQSTRLSFTDKYRMCQVVKAMVWVESHYEPSDGVLSTAYDMAK